MSFTYIQNQVQTAITPPAKVPYCKSYKIDIAAGSGFTTATPYTLGILPVGSQLVWGTIICSTPVSGGTVSAATLGVTLGGQALSGAPNVFIQGTYTPAIHSYMAANIPESGATQALVYTPTLTGSGATTGVIYITLYYIA